MCWNATATAAMVGLGAIAIGVSMRRKNTPIVPLTLGYFTIMEVLQLAGYGVIDRCGNPANQVVTFLSILHIVFQPFFINAFILSFSPAVLRKGALLAIYGICALSSVVMLMQLYPFEWANACTRGSTLCGPALCTVSGDWHLAWDVPYNGLLSFLEKHVGLGSAFPTYTFAAFILPALYGAWRFVLFHAAAGPWLAMYLTTKPNEIPAIWCLFAIGIIVIALSPAVRRLFEWKPMAALQAR